MRIGEPEPILRWFALALTGVLGLTLAGCASEPSKSSTPPSDASTPVCEPWDARACECPYGQGQQNCAGDGSGYGACVCPVKNAVLQPGVKEIVIDESAGMRVMNNALLLPLSGGEPPYAPNDIIVSWTGAGFLGRVARVVATSEGYRVDTEGPVSLDEAFSELDISFDDALNIAGGLSKAERDETFIKDKVGIGFGTGGFSVAVSGALHPTMRFEPSSSLAFTPYGTFRLKFRKVAKVPVGIKEFKFGIGLDAQLKLVSTVGLEGAGSVAGEIEVFQAAQRLLGNPAPMPLTFPIGAGLSGRIYLNLGCGLTVGGSIELTSTLEAGVNAYGGVYWSKGKLLPDTALSKNFSSGVEELAWSVDAVLECYLRPRVGLNLLRVFEVYVEEGPYGQFGVHINRAPYTDFNVGFKGTLGGELGIQDLDLVLAEVSYDLFDYKRTLWRKDFSICGDGYQQLDEECDIGPYYTLHPRVVKPEPAWCDRSCVCTAGYAPRLPPRTRPSGEEWGSDQNSCDPTCGNYKLDPGEVCDRFLNGRGCGGCAEDCSRRLGVCGDGHVDAQCGERCDVGLPPCQGGCGSSCTMPPLVCGDGVNDVACGERCDDGNTLDGDTCSSTCQASTRCGDGILGAREQCDDGNNLDCDGCNDWCQVETGACGDFSVCGDEECDNGGWSTYDCRADCKRNRCGDGITSAARFEQCDDGVETATCTQSCQLSYCGDNYTNTAAGEECDSGGVDTWSCDADCTFPSCGDSHINAARETCDDGDADDCTTACNYNCTRAAAPAVCGDGFVNFWCGEDCDDGADNGTCGKCGGDCLGKIGVCGDGKHEPACGELCDDGNTSSGDGCRADCRGIEECGDGFADGPAGEICDDGTLTACVGVCNETCSAFYTHVCHNGVKEACELCEDTNTANTGPDDGCPAPQPHCNGCKGCSAAVCGDGKLEAGEACEPVGMCADESAVGCTLLDASVCPQGVGCVVPIGPGLCIETCQRTQSCGDGFVDGTEGCDDGNQGGCNVDCSGVAP